MNFFDKLKELIRVRDTNLFNNIFSNNLKIENLHIHLDKGSNKDFKQENNNLIIDVFRVPEIKQLIREDLNILISSDDYKKLETIEDTPNINKYQSLRGIIPDKDYDILKASVVIREKFKNKQDIQKLKEELVESYGTRARRISNLCSAGYFDYMIEILDELKKDESFNIESFRKFYEIIIDEEAFSVFVHVGLNENLKEIILNKLERNKSYGIKYVNIHALNKVNVNLANKVIREILEEFKNIDIAEKKDSGTNLFVKLKDTEA